MNNDKRKWLPGSWIPKTDVDRMQDNGNNISVRVGGSWFDVYPSAWIDGSDVRDEGHTAYLVRWELSDYEKGQRGLE